LLRPGYCSNIRSFPDMSRLDQRLLPPLAEGSSVAGGMLKEVGFLFAIRPDGTRAEMPPSHSASYTWETLISRPVGAPADSS
jgi:hypothetical protein